MVSIERFADILEVLAEELPEEFYEDLNLGVSIDSCIKLHPQAREGDLFILGEYCRSNMGQGIVIYYGSFERMYANLSEDELSIEMRKILRHEFRHHIEWRAGEYGLEKEDEQKLSEYLNS